MFIVAFPSKQEILSKSFDQLTLSDLDYDRLILNSSCNGRSRLRLVDLYADLHVESFVESTMTRTISVTFAHFYKSIGDQITAKNPRTMNADWFNLVRNDKSH